ncbi:MAG: putative multidrug efflux pump, outer membrane protein [Clostridia bacterium]|jgi:hypothetical protein|nr:putative multidrug efflux pump, outer membrane protein [Clostridia bacterium]
MNFFKKAAAIGITIICLGGQLVFGADTPPILTLEDSVKAGFIYSNQLSLNAQEKDLLKERLKANQNSFYETYQSIYLQQAKNDNERKVLQDQITYDITNRYNTIIILEKELISLDHTIQIKTKELGQMKVKKEVGVISSIQYDSIQIELENLVNSKKSKLESLSNEKSYFKLVTGKELTKYTLEDTLSYEAFRVPGDADQYMNTKIADYLKYDNDLAQFAKDHIIIAGTPVIFYDDYLNKKYEADKSLSSLEDARKTMKDALMKSYSSLITLEEQINTLQTKQKLVQRQVSIAKTQYDVGRGTVLEYNRQMLNLENIELDLRKLITNYNLLKQVIEKPWAITAANH